MTRLIPLHRWVLIGLAAAIPGSTGLLASSGAPIVGAQPHEKPARDPLGAIAGTHPLGAAAATDSHGAATATQPTSREAARQLPIGVSSSGVLVTPTRTADASHAAALFAGHSWYVPPPPPPPVAAPPPPPPSAPPFPYTFVGSYAPAGEGAVYFLARSDRVVDAHVGDHLDGVYVFESAGPEGLVFNYLPLNIRQTVTTGGSP
ncbi:MAG: secretion system X translation initiation factor [Proteobacteria bacterium]|nr:secretion system X translation initiation factor [Pseudomonadota bacterium]